MGKVRKHLLLLTAFVLLMRVPFLNQAVSGDDVYYLAAAYHGLIDPLHPNHTTYVFEGRDVNFQGYPHPPGNAWVLAALLTIFHDVHEIPFHAAYVVFSLLAVYAAYALAVRFSPIPLWAAALFAVVPAFFVNGNSFEADVPFLAFWMAGAAAFVYGVDRKRNGLMLLSALCLALSAMIAMQAFLFTPILLAYVFLRRDSTGRERWAGVLTACVPVMTLIIWQCFERVSSGQFPAQVSAGYMSSYGYQRAAMKLRNAAALSIHLCFMMFPVLLPFMARQVWRARRDRSIRFLALWIVIFLLGAWILFFAGSARYLLPLAAPLAILASFAPISWVRAAFAAQLTLSLALAVVNYQHWGAYRVFAASLRPQMDQRRVWVNGEWGLRHYLEAVGALPLHREQWVPTGDIVVGNELANPAPYSHGGRRMVSVAHMEIDPWLPLRIIGLNARSGFSTDGEGLLPFDVRGGAIDRVEAVILRQQEPVLSMLAMSAPEADAQILYGIYLTKGNPWSWMGKAAEVHLKSPQRSAELEVKIYIADAAVARAVTVSVLNGPSTTRTFPGPGAYTMLLPVDATSLNPVSVRISVDRTFSTPSDQRQLGIILQSVGFVS